jgi:two-component system NtrC family sensor kinase
MGQPKRDRRPSRVVEVLDPAPTAQQWTVLVVDDEPEVASLTAELLALDGYEVHTVGNGRLALEELAIRPYDVILSDVNMPQLDGPGLYQEVASRFPHLLARMVFLSGNAFAYEEFFLKTGVRCLCKPVGFSEIRRAVRESLGLDA